MKRMFFCVVAMTVGLLFAGNVFAEKTADKESAAAQTKDQDKTQDKVQDKDQDKLQTKDQLKTLDKVQDKDQLKTQDKLQTKDQQKLFVDKDCDGIADGTMTKSQAKKAVRAKKGSPKADARSKASASRKADKGSSAAANKSANARQ